MSDSVEYGSWYHTPRGQWIGDREFRLMMQQLQAVTGSSLLNQGCGTGHFSHRVAGAGLSITDIDPDRKAIVFAHNQGNVIDYLEGMALELPFGDGSFDDCSAVTSLCFVAQPERVIAEIWRVSRKAVVVGLLNRHSLLNCIEC